MNKISAYWLLLVAGLILSACSTTKYVPENDRLYLGGTVKVKDKDVKKQERKLLEADLNTLLRPRPNSSILGIRFKLMIYGLRSKSGKGLGSWLARKFGEPPVLFSTVKVDYNQKLVSNRLENRGYFRATDTTDTIFKGAKKVKLEYHAFPGPQYMINSVKFTTDSSDLGKAVSATAAASFLKVGDAYNLDVVKSERERIDGHLKEQGFYFFSPEDLIVQVDSTNNEHKVDMYVNIKRTTSEKARDIYSINNIYIYPNYRLRDTTATSRKTMTFYDDFYVIDPRKTFKPQIFSRTMFFRKGDVYNRIDHNLSLNRLVNLGTFKFVKNRFEEADSAGKPMLDVYYQLTPYQRKSIRAEVTGRTNSANFTGSEFTLSWRNRNAFKGAELLTFSTYISTDVQVSSASKSFNNIYRYGAEATLSIPKFIVPFKVRSNSAYIPRTKISLGYDFLNRPDSYTLTSLRSSFGYTWKENVRKEHQLSVLALNYLQPSKVTPYYDSVSNVNPTLKHTIEKQFTIGPIYNYNYTNTNETFKKNTFYFNGNIDISGNIPGLTSVISTPFSKYIRVEGDFRHYRKLGLNSTLASRIIAGYGYSYASSTSMPYVKQFFIGGTNSLRGFRARTLGPGTYRDPSIGTNTVTADQSGDIKLEMNTEFRPTLAGIVKGALFIDAGNIWLQNAETGALARPGVKFSKDFLNELAMDAGFGLRFDLSFLILRTDLAFPIRKPWLPKGDRWVLSDVNFGDKAWRKDNLIFNLAIGYPF
ncbi:translocation and assembly module lipoprotein TamL [Hufsiella ginkgonis]|uniref:BamA/TamA family outer membrane protein n=1 Tax=Hufsiella ginkgonis TaxID=2695274 RepID=A0A7K1Y1R5_9SPHI|nr:BamA/TamA family outer membrane protein [Hufsiella ginkgonis]MXV17161.1 BamA/TamA family outer membrane protein [Hufsiella ginkgonis]